MERQEQESSQQVTLVARPNCHRERAFPLPAEIVEGVPSPWFAAAKSPFGWFPAASLSGLLWLHRAALSAEADGFWSRADFYWREFDWNFAKLRRRSGGLSGALAALGSEIGERLTAEMGGELASTTFVDEILIDGHAALYNSRVGTAEAKTKNRGAYHLDRIKARIADSGMTAPERAAMLRPFIRATAKGAESSGRWADAAEHYGELLNADPEDREGQEGVLHALWKQIEGILGSDNSETAARREAAALDPVINKLDALVDRIPYNADLYDTLAQAQLLRSVRLANSRQISEALTAVEKALAARPSWDEAVAVKVELKKMMESLQEHVRTVEAKLRTTANATLTAEGAALQRQAGAGFAAAERFAASDRANRLSTFSEQARGRRFWLSLGLAAPEDGDWNAQAQILMNSLASILSAEPKTREAMEAHWDVVIAGQPGTAGLDRERIIRFLEYRLIGREWKPETQAPVPAEETHGAPLTIPLGSVVRKSGPVPFGDWLGSRQDFGLKANIVAAVAAAAVATGLLVHEQLLVAERDRDVSAMVDAQRQQDDTAVMKAASDFLCVHPFSSDSRESSVVSAYQRAFVHWMTALPGDFKPQEDQAFVDRYRQLVSEQKGTNL